MKSAHPQHPYFINHQDYQVQAIFHMHSLLKGSVNLKPYFGLQLSSDSSETSSRPLGNYELQLIMQQTTNLTHFCKWKGQIIETLEHEKLMCVTIPDASHIY